MQKNYVRTLAGIFFAVAMTTIAYADLPGRHPAYLHALTDLRTARWMVEHRPGRRTRECSRRRDCHGKSMQPSVRSRKPLSTTAKTCGIIRKSMSPATDPAGCTRHSNYCARSTTTWLAKRTTP